MQWLARLGEHVCCLIQCRTSYWLRNGRVSQGCQRIQSSAGACDMGEGSVDGVGQRKGPRGGEQPVYGSGHL